MVRRQNLYDLIRIDYSICNFPCHWTISYEKNLSELLEILLSTTIVGDIHVCSMSVNDIYIGKRILAIRNCMIFQHIISLWIQVSLCRSHRRSIHLYRYIFEKNRKNRKQKKSDRYIVFCIQSLHSSYVNILDAGR